MGRDIDSRRDIDDRVSHSPVFSLLNGEGMAKRNRWFRGMVVIVLVLIAWVFFISSKQLKRSERIEKEVALLETEAERIRHENETLSEKIQYFSSDDFREQEAKKKLGLKKEKERVVVINPKMGSEQRVTKNEEMRETDDDLDVPNYEKWWKLFF